MGRKSHGLRKKKGETEREFFTFTSGVLGAASRGLPRTEFYREVLELLIRYADCDTILAGIREGAGDSCVASLGPSGGSFRFAVRDREGRRGGKTAPTNGAEEDMLRVLRLRTAQKDAGGCGFFSESGSFWTNDASGFLRHANGNLRRALVDDDRPGRPCESVAMVPFSAGEAGSGYLRFGVETPGAFGPEQVEILEHAAQMVSVALLHRHATWSLRERVKELSCLYKIANILDMPEKPLAVALGKIVRIIPPAWLHADVAAARITFDNQSLSTEGFREGAQSQSAPIVVHEQQRGLIEVIYTQTMPDLDEGPFLFEERKLLDTIALDLSVRIERGLYEKQQRKLQEQMRHSNRLAMVGQLASAVAHEINGPLTNILGFAQLAIKCPGLPDQASSDLDKIVATSLHAREIVRKLLLYGRKMPQRESLVNVNRIAEEGLSFFERRLAKEGIALSLSLADDVGWVRADPGQLRQVVANLLINAIQAMPKGGSLTVETGRSQNQVVLVVQDTGCGMSPEIKDKIFIPFFTTKSVHEGTGLGLPVVHEIVSGLKGAISVESSPNVGTCVEVRLPAAPPVSEGEDKASIP